MKAHLVPILAIVLLAVVSSLHAQNVPLKQCPEPVVATIRSQLGTGRVDKVKMIRIESRVLYLVEIDLPGRPDRKLHVAADGTLLKVVEEVRLNDLPQAVRQALEPFLAGGGRLDEAERITVSGKTEYHVEVDLPGGVDLHLFFGEGGEILRRFESGF